MQPFSFVEANSVSEALQAAGVSSATFFAGGTTLIDLMKIDVMTPAQLVDVNRLPLSSIEEAQDGIIVGANVRNSDLAHHPLVRERFPVLSEALLAGASAQIRNMASTAGNLLQRTRCPYFRDVQSACNKRHPGSGCDALSGFNRSHAVLGTSSHCIAVHPSDMCVALMILDAKISTQRRDGTTREIPLNDFYLLPGDTPERENVLEPGELITHVHVPNSDVAKRSHYLKVRDRASYEFALASAAVAIRTDGSRIVGAKVALGGIATIPWRSREAEAALINKPATHETFQAAAEVALADAKPQKHNAFKIPLAKHTFIAALDELIHRG
ncbi:MAG TPA: xanthine dehydrogenase family protein subunit M [Bryobacteraceae bacterium]|nr:xanthine dehydrogenase family protein subunit M [Bryobacteraceae bacterium]